MSDYEYYFLNLRYDECDEEQKLGRDYLTKDLPTKDME